jgi:redox-sensitive bicupin YhaK (pirin superfamily)
MPGPGTHNRGLQLWVNLPRRLKAMTPEYQGVERLPVEESRGRRVREIVGYKSPADLKTEVHYFDITLDGGHPFEREIAPGWNTLLYVVSGSLEAAGERLARGDGVVLGDGKLSVRGAGRFVFLSGVPHDEPILLRGPFVD